MNLKDFYIIPRMEEWTDYHGRAKILIAWHSYSSLWKLPIKFENKKKTEFTFHAGTLQNMEIRFGLGNEPTMFNRDLYFILPMSNWKSCLIYFEDVIICSNDI